MTQEHKNRLGLEYLQRKVDVLPWETYDNVMHEFYEVVEAWLMEQRGKGARQAAHRTVYLPSVYRKEGLPRPTTRMHGEQKLDRTLFSAPFHSRRPA